MVRLSDSTVLRLQAHTLPSSPFALGSWSSNLGPCDFKANISLTELSSQDQSRSVFSPHSLNTGRLYTSVFEPLPFPYFPSPSCELRFHTSITGSLLCSTHFNQVFPLLSMGMRQDRTEQETVPSKRISLDHHGSYFLLRRCGRASHDTFSKRRSE